MVTDEFKTLFPTTYRILDQTATEVVAKIGCSHDEALTFVYRSVAGQLDAVHRAVALRNMNTDELQDRFDRVMS
jgi:hypothetical protein